MKKIFFLASLFLVGMIQTVYAGVVPGTINKGTYTSSTTCNTSTNSYNPSSGYCSNTYCRTFAQGSSSVCGACTSYQQLANTCTISSASVCGTHCTAYAPSTPNYTSYSCYTCTTYNSNGTCATYGMGTCSYISSYTPGACTATAANSCSVTSSAYCGTHNGSCLTYPTCRNATFGCADYYHYPVPTGSLTFTNYLYSNLNPNYGLSGDSRKLVNDVGQTCNKWADGTYHTPPWMGGTNSCQDGSSSYYIGGSNGVCNKFGSTDNLITSFNQVGSVSRSAPVDTDASCTVQGRYATTDDSGPNISLNSVSNVLDGDQNNWCNYTKYRAANYGTTNNPILPGCTYYKNKISHTIAGVSPDLLEGLGVSVSDTSGISGVTIEIGKCTASYGYPTGIASVVASTTSPSGAKSTLQSITYNYNSPSSLGDTSLLQRFGVARLDSCLMEGKNYIKVTANDQARSNNDGVSYSPNTSILDLSASTKFLKIDNSGPAIGLSGNASKIAESNATANMFVGPVTIEPSASSWKNYTITGNLKSTDPFGADSLLQPPSCTTYTGSTYTCTTSATKGTKPSATGVVWNAPLGVNPTTGVFTGYMCDSLGPIPSTASCDWGCATGYTFDTTANACVASSNLFILFDAGTPNANGNLSAKLTGDPSNSRGLLKNKTAGNCSAPYITTAVKSYNFKYQSLATYNFPTVPTGPFQIVENGMSSCPMPPPPPPVYTYDWFGGTWGTCTGACGTNGIRNRTVVCKRNDGAPASDSQCAGAKPATSEACAVAACTGTDNCPAGDFSGNPSDGICMNICTAGGVVPCIVQVSPKPTPTCSDGTQNGTETGVDCGGSCGACTVAPYCATTPSFANIGTTTTGSPTTTRQAWTYSATAGNCTYSCANGYSGTNCTTAPVSYSWSTGTWGSCSATCGGGTQTRTVVCQNNNGNTVADSYCSGVKPDVSLGCNTGVCPGVHDGVAYNQLSSIYCTELSGYHNSIAVYDTNSPGSGWDDNLIGGWMYPGWTYLFDPYTHSVSSCTKTPVVGTYMVGRYYQNTTVIVSGVSYPSVISNDYLYSNSASRCDCTLPDFSSQSFYIDSSRTCQIQSTVPTCTIDMSGFNGGGVTA